MVSFFILFSVLYPVFQAISHPSLYWFLKAKGKTATLMKHILPHAAKVLGVCILAKVHFSQQCLYKENHFSLASIFFGHYPSLFHPCTHLSNQTNHINEAYILQILLEGTVFTILVTFLLLSLFFFSHLTICNGDTETVLGYFPIGQESQHSTSLTKMSIMHPPDSCIFTWTAHKHHIFLLESKG